MSSLVKIDDLLRGEHGSLSSTDECYYLLEYTAREGFSYSHSNDLIQNLKKPMDRKGRPEWKYKEWAIKKIAAELTPALPVVIDFSITTIIPIPPSKIRTNPLYDDRLTRILQLACPTHADILELIVCREDCAAAHDRQAEDRPTVEEIMENYELNGAVRLSIQPNVVLFDDMITGGNHYVACRNFITGNYPGRRVIGIFVSRRVFLPEVSPFDDWDEF